MPRLAKFTHDQIVDATARLAARAGPAQATMARIAGALRAPTGSIYHRFASRDVLLGEVWLRAAQAFQDGFIGLLAGPCSWDAGLAAALFVPARVRQEPAEARILLLHRREDFLAAGWPPQMSVRAADLKRQADTALRKFSRSLLGRADAEALRSVTYALVQAPMAAVLPHLRANESPPASVEPLIRATYVAVMALAGASITAKRKQA
jgi:AcrR family transcriptional regulator